MPASGPLAIDLGGPTAGHLWRVLRLTIAAAPDPRVDVAGRVDTFVGRPPTAGSVLLDPLEWIDGAAKIPNTSTFDRTQCPVEDGEHVYNVISDVAADTKLVVTAEIEDGVSDR